MKIGDLVRYGDGDPKGHIGIVVNTHRNRVITVLWANGVESNHSASWVGLIETSENT